jgi:putative lipoic acid-binding regulatory protein
MDTTTPIEERFARLKELLSNQHTWPCPYTFKFITARSHLPQVLALFPGETPTIRPSAKANYVGVTFFAEMPSSDAVLAIYRQAALIEGLIAL